MIDRLCFIKFERNLLFGVKEILIFVLLIGWDTFWADESFLNVVDLSSKYLIIIMWKEEWPLEAVWKLKTVQVLSSSFIVHCSLFELFTKIRCENIIDFWKKKILTADRN